MKNNSLQKRLAAYTALSVPFFAMSHHADAQILYTDVSPDDTLNMCDTAALDLNNDGVMDFMLGVGKDVFTYWYGCLIMKNESGSNRIAGIATYYSSTSGSSAAYFKLPNKLNYLDPIGASNNWVNPLEFNATHWCNGAPFPYHQAVFNFFLMGENQGNWNAGPTEGYVGLKINMNNESYYGWARLVVDSDARWMILKDYAIDTIPNESIGAGEGMPPAASVLLESPESSVIVSPNPATDHFLISIPKNNSLITQLNMIDMEGRKRTVDWIKSESGLLVNTSGLNAGIYFAEVKTSGTVYRKKVLIQK